LNNSQIGSGGSGTGGGQNSMKFKVGGPRHHRGNSDGVPSITSKLNAGTHTRGSSGNNA